MAWKCPNCEEEIDSLRFEVNTSSSEYGTADLNDSKKKKDETYYEIVVNHDCEDNGDTEWDGSPEYRCPECDDYINPDNLIWIDTEEEKTKEKKKLEEPEETLHNVIKPQNSIIQNEISKDITDSSIICKKCFHVFIHRIERGYFGTEDKQNFLECPHCGQTNSLEEFKELLEKGIFNKHVITKKIK